MCIVATMLNSVGLEAWFPFFFKIFTPIYQALVDNYKILVTLFQRERFHLIFSRSLVYLDYPRAPTTYNKKIPNVAYQNVFLEPKKNLLW